MNIDLQPNLESIDNVDRRTGLLIGLGIVGLVILVVGLLFAAGPVRSAIGNNDAPDDLEDFEPEALD